MALKTKIKWLIKDIKESSTGSKSPMTEDFPVSDFADSPAVAKFKAHINEPTDPLIEQEVIDSIEAIYFSDDSVDTSKHELDKFAEKTVDLEAIDQSRKRLGLQLAAVSKKVSDLVLENHPAFQSELHKVMELQRAVQTSSAVCANGRRQLANASHGFTIASLKLCSNYRKRQQLSSLMKSVHMIKTLQRTDVRLREMLEEEDYAGAIQLCLECQSAAIELKHFKCISDLSTKLQDTLVIIEESLDVALSRTCSGFESSHYTKLQTAYKMLEKTHTAMDQLHMHFTNNIHNTSFQIVLGFVELLSGTGDGSFQKKQYAELCRHISHEMFTPCLIDLCKALWDIMKSYQMTLEWHQKDIKENCGSGDAAKDEESYTKQRLFHGLGRIWGDVQQKVRIYILSTDLSHFSYDDFIKVLDIVNRLILIGEEFCGSRSEGLQESIRKQSINYFRAYHRGCLEDLKMFMENETWQRCPVKPEFSIIQLHEFKFLRLMKEQHEMHIQAHDDVTSKGPRGLLMSQSNPFDFNHDDDRQEDILQDDSYVMNGQDDSDSDDDVPDELKQDYIDENTGDPVPVRKPSQRSAKSGGRPSPLITNTTLSVCRFFGKYMQMMQVLKPIAFDVVLYMSQLFDYYLHTVFNFFSEDTDLDGVGQDSVLSGRLRATLRRIRESLILDNEAQPPGSATAVELEERKDKVAQPYLTSQVQLNDPSRLFGMAERIVATESLLFLAEQFQLLQSDLEDLIPAAKKAFLQQFYSQTVSTASELRRPVYRAVASLAIDFSSIYGQMASVRWDVKELMSQHNHYVDCILQEFHNLKLRLAEVGRHVPVPTPVRVVLWEYCIGIANYTFVEGFAAARKCSNEGRALMQLDFQQFLIKVEKITDLRPSPGREYVEGYIKAYYLPETQLESWLKDHREYSSKQTVALINCVPHLNKKTRQRLVTQIEETEKPRR